MATPLYQGNENGGTYSNRTMMHNWFEDRQNPSSPSRTGLDSTTTFNRVFHKSPGDHAAPSLFSTTKKSSDLDMLEKKKVDDVAATAPNLTTVHGKPTQSRMYSGSHSLDERVATYGRPASLAYTLPPAAGKQADDIEAEKKRFDGTTTNRFFYEDLPAQARSSPPKQGYFDTTLDDTKHRKTMNLEREKAFFATDGAAFISPYLATSTRSTGAGTGKMGRMGDFTRNPKEAGSVYGVSIWADEYAQWGNKLKGKTLGETRSKAMTKHF